MPVTDAESWTVLDDEGSPVAPIESYLAYLSGLERSVNTVRAYAGSLKLWFEFLAQSDVAWNTAGLDDVCRFVAWLRAPGPNVVVLAEGAARRKPATVNRHLAAVFDFYDHLARSGGGGPGPSLAGWRRAGGRSYTPFLHHVTKGNPMPVRPVKLRVPGRAARTLSHEEVVAIVEACEHLRDRFFFALLADTGMRVGQALGLRHGDFVSRERLVRIVPRADNANGARAKTHAVAEIPISAALCRLYSEYMHLEYGDLDSDYIFVNLWAKPWGRPMTYAAVHKLVARLRSRTGIFFTAHMLRHTHATDLIRAGVSMEVVARLLTHRSSTTTSRTYVHLDVADVRTELERASMLSEAIPSERPSAAQSAVARRHRRRTGPGRSGGRVCGGSMGRHPPRRPCGPGERARPLRCHRPALAERGDQAVVPVAAGHRLRLGNHRGELACHLTLFGLLGRLRSRCARGADPQPGPHRALHLLAIGHRACRQHPGAVGCLPAGVLGAQPPASLASGDPTGCRRLPGGRAPTGYASPSLRVRVRHGSARIR